MSYISGPGAGFTPPAASLGAPERGPVIVQVATGQTGDMFQLKDNTGNIIGRQDLQGREYGGGGPTPTAAAGANAGTTPPAPVVTSGDTDMRGNITFGTGATPAAGAMVVVTFANAWLNAPFVMVTPKNTATQALGLYVTGVSTTGFTLSCTTAPAASQANTVFSFDFLAQG